MPDNQKSNQEESHNFFAFDPVLKEANICTKPECLTDGRVGKPHRHNLPSCKEHPYCIDDPLKEEVPLWSTLPEPLPDSRPGYVKKFIKGVAEETFGETGPQAPDTKSVVTQYGLDHYLAQ